MINVKDTTTVVKQSAKSKTINFGLLLVILGFVEKDTNIIPTLFGDGNQSLAYSVVGLIVIILRYVTDRPVMEK